MCVVGIEAMISAATSTGASAARLRIAKNVPPTSIGAMTSMK